MKNILDGLAVLANKADAEGNIRVADQIDNLIKVIAAFDPADEQLFEEQMQQGRVTITEPLEVTVPGDKKAEIEKMHERARLIMQETVKMFKDAGEQAPMEVPPSKVTGKQILDFLKLTGQGAPLKGWHDMMKRLNNIKAQTASHFGAGTPSPFSSATPAAAPQSGDIKRVVSEPGPFLSAPTPTAGSGTSTVNTGTKGPPVPPVLT